jgi:hypothetical protein
MQLRTFVVFKIKIQAVPSFLMNTAGCEDSSVCVDLLVSDETVGEVNQGGRGIA